MIEDTTRTTVPMTFEPPAPGQWELETTHHGLRPLSPIIRDAYRRGFEEGTVELVERYGLPLTRVQAKFVHGCLYVRPLGVGERARLHSEGPSARVRDEGGDEAAPGAPQTNQVRRVGMEGTPVAPRGRSLVRPGTCAAGRKNLALQAVELTELDDAQLAAHATSAVARGLRGVGAPEPGDARRRSHASG